MLAYVANRPRAGERRSSPNIMLAIIALHIAGVAVLMSAKMDLPTKLVPNRTIIDLIEDDPLPEPKIVPEPSKRPLDPPLMAPQPLVPTPPTPMDPVDPLPLPLPDPSASVGTVPLPGPIVDPIPLSKPERVSARLITSPSELRPPYPASKLSSGEEAVLRLRLAIDERGRVVAVDPVGTVDRTFLDAARRHILRHWRYRAATENGRAVVSATVVSLRFQIES